MTHAEFYLLIDNVIEAAPGTVKGTEVLTNLSAWDSLAVVGFIAALDKHLQTNVSARLVVEAKTIEDLARLVSGKLSN